MIAERFAGDLATANAAPDTNAPLLRRDVRFRSYRVGDDKFVEASDGRVFFFDLGEQPDEQTDTAASRSPDVARLRSELDTWQAALGLPAIDAPVAAGEVPELDSQARERLKALGYVE